jgi:hypothetical protein
LKPNPFAFNAAGIQIDHPDLRDIIWKNPVEIAGNGVDDDGNGYTDDVNGWDFYTNDTSVYDGTSDDHATHVAGTIGATGNNGVGVVGVCQRGVKIIPAKFLGVDGGSTAGAINALYYLWDLKKRYSLNMVATSNSCELLRGTSTIRHSCLHACAVLHCAEPYCSYVSNRGCHLGEMLQLVSSAPIACCTAQTTIHSQPTPHLNPKPSGVIKEAPLYRSTRIADSIEL